MLDKFRYTTQAGKVIVLPPMQSVKSGVLRKNRNKPEIEFMFLILESIVDDENLELLDELGMDETGDLYEKWQEFNGVTVGESSGSSTSSTPTEEPSSTTGDTGSTLA